MGDFAGVELGTPSKNECGKCGMSVKDKPECCHDDVKLVKLTQDQAAATYAVFALGMQQALPVTQSFLTPPAMAVELLHAQPVHGPPLISGQDTYLRNCVFRI